MVKVAFVGRSVEHRPWALSAPAGDLVPAFVDVRASTPPQDVLDRIGAEAPDVVIVLAPGLVPGALLAELGALKVAVVSEEVPALYETDVWHASPDVDALLAQTAIGDLPLAAYDRVVATDPLLARASSPDVWRCAPLPVDDALFADELPTATGLSPLFVGESTAFRERWLTDAKHHYELSHYAYGLEGDALLEVLQTHDVGVLVRREAGLATFAPTAGLHLAAGHLLITEPLRPTRGLEPGLDHLVVQEPDQLMHLLYQCRRRPAAFDYVRRRGRIRAEELRASRVWPRLVADLRADVAAFA